jgi:DNA phosphorothioation-dependent restriction protein DptG
MTELERATEIHKKSMTFAQEAHMARIFNDEPKALMLNRQSLELEREVVAIYADRHDEEPMRSMLYVSAASMAMLCHLYQEANSLIDQGLTVHTPSFVKLEFEELREQIAQHKEKYEQISNGDLEQPFWISGILKRVDADKNTVKLASKATDTIPQTLYTINVASETLNKLVKNYWGDIVKVYIKPKNKKGKPSPYELLEIS